MKAEWQSGLAAIAHTPNWRWTWTHEERDVWLFYAANIAVTCIVETYFSHRYIWLCIARLWFGFVCLATLDAYRMWRKYFAGRKQRHEDGCPSKLGRPRLGVRPWDQWIQKPEEVQPGVLDMDHIYLSFEDYLWGKTFVGLPLLYGFLFGGPESNGFIWIQLREKLEEAGWLQPVPPRDQRYICADMLLGTQLAVYYVGSVEQDDGTVKGWFQIPDAAYLTLDSTVQYGMLNVELDLKDKVLIRASLNDSDLAPSDTLILLWLALATQIHPQVHAYANWGVNLHSRNPFLRRMSVITVMFNSFGQRGLPEWFDCLHLAGFFKFWQGKHLVGSEAQPGALDRVRQGCPVHRNIHELQKYSPYIDFVMKVRSVFMKQFAKHRADFVGVDKEGLFIGTVLHSLDHCQGLSLCTYSDLTCTNPEMRANLELMRSVQEAFLDRHYHKIMYEVRFKDAPHPLFLSTYKFAAGINAKWADNLECTVAR